MRSKCSEAKEQKTRRSLGVIEAALKALKSEHVDTEAELWEPEEALFKLKKRLDRTGIAREKLPVECVTPAATSKEARDCSNLSWS